jgi:hypothetical protein
MLRKIAYYILVDIQVVDSLRCISNPKVASLPPRTTWAPIQTNIKTGRRAGLFTALAKFCLGLRLKDLVLRPRVWIFVVSNVFGYTQAVLEKPSGTEIM